MASISIRKLINKQQAPAAASAPAETPVVETEVVASEPPAAEPAPAPNTVTPATVAKPAPAKTVVKPATVAKPAPAKTVAKPASTALATTESAEPVGEVVPFSAAPLGGIAGEVTARDIQIPYLSLVQKQGKLFDEMPDSLGNFVYDKQLDLGNEIQVVFMRVQKSYEEDLPYGSEKIPGRWISAAEYRAAGFNDSQVKEVATLDLLVEIPMEGNEAVGELTDITHNGNYYLPARWMVRSTAYGRTFPVLLRDAKGWLKGSTLNGFYKITTERKVNQDTSWFVPTLSPANKTEAALTEQIVSKFSL